MNMPRNVSRQVPIRQGAMQCSILRDSVEVVCERDAYLFEMTKGKVKYLIQVSYQSLE